MSSSQFLCDFFEDVILAADVVYFEEQDPLVDALKESDIFSATCELSF